MNHADVRFLPAGDTAVVVEFGDRIDRALSDRVLRLGAKLRAVEITGMIDMVPTYCSLLVGYDLMETDGLSLRRHLAAASRP
jgi:allophanate hydrolase subunit 1